MKSQKIRQHRLLEIENFSPSLVFWKSYLANFALLILSSGETSAGWISGRNVVWVNLDKSPSGAQVDRVIASFLDKKPTACDGIWSVKDSWLYMKRRPPKITDDLVANVFKSGEASKIKKLHAALKGYKDEYLDDGFDGIIVYSNFGEGKMMRMTTGRRKIETVTVSSTGKQPRSDMVESAFCFLLPPVARLP
jgi:hypothetical protein